MILNNLCPRVKIESTVNEAVHSDDIYELKKFANIELPKDYIEFLSNPEVAFEIDNHFVFCVWPPKRCVELNMAYDVQKYLPNSLAIGSDLGDALIVYLDGERGLDYMD